MNIKITDTEKLQAAIKAAEGRATARTLTTDRIERILDRVEELNGFSIPHIALVGTVVTYSGAEKFSSRYKYTPESTWFTAEYKRTGWVITDIARKTCPNRYSNVEVKYSDAALERIMGALKTRIM